MKKYFLHIDLDAFFASVEQLDHKEFRGRPVIVGGLPQNRRGVVSTASYEARKFGVHSAMPSAQAARLCPQGIFVPVNMSRYLEKSSEVMSILKNFSPDVFQISIDEATVDLTGTEKLFGNPVECAQKIKSQIKEKTGITASAGLASTHYVAKIASEVKKPDGFFAVPHGKEVDFLLSLPLKKLWGAGKKTLEKLNKYGITSMRDLYNWSENLLQKTFGNATGTFLFNAVRGKENPLFTKEAKSHSVSAETTFPFDLIEPYAIETALLELVETVHFRLLRENLISRTPFVKIRYEDFLTVSAQESGNTEIISVEDFFDRVKRIFAKKYEKGRAIRLLGVGAQNIESNENPHQSELFDFGGEKQSKVERAILEAQKKTNIKIKKARLF